METGAWAWAWVWVWVGKESVIFGNYLHRNCGGMVEASSHYWISFVCGEPTRMKDREGRHISPTFLFVESIGGVLMERRRAEVSRVAPKTCWAGTTDALFL